MSKRNFSEIMMDILGSWPVFFLVLLATNGPALWDLWHHKSTERLDLNISIWTLQLDMVFLIGQNYTRKADRKLIRQMRADLTELKGVIVSLREWLKEKLND